MNIFTYAKLKFQEYIIWLQRKWHGDVRPIAIAQPYKPAAKKRKTTTTTTKRKTK